MILTNKLYDILKWISLVLLPALAVFYMSLAPVWGLPYSEQIVATIAALDLFLGALLGISVKSYNQQNPMYRLNLVKLVGVPEGGWIISTGTYNALTWISQILLPALAAFYGALSTIWGFPFGEQVVSTIMVIDTFLGMLLGFSTGEFHKQAARMCVDAPEARLDNPVG